MTDPRPDRQARLSAAALDAKQANAGATHHPETDDHPNEGAASLPRRDYPPSGAFDAEGHRPALGRSRFVR
jgi:hypothetical protein